MPANTPNRNYPYPVDTDLIDVADDIENLATALDTDFDAVLAQVDNKVSVSGDTMTGMLTLPGTNPTSLNHAVRKGWADTTYLNKTGDAMSGDLVMNGHNITELGPPTGDNMAARKAYVDNVFADAVKKSNTGSQTIQGVLHAEKFILTTGDPPDGPYQCTPKWYVDQEISQSGLTQDEADTRYINKNGDTMEGALLAPSSPFVLGGEWDQSQAALRLESSGQIRSTVTAGASMVLNRAGSANAADQHYIEFNYSVDQPHGTIQIQEDGSGINITNVVNNQPSDYRMKERTGPVVDAARRVQTLARHAFRGRWKVNGKREREFLNAHHVAEVAPYVVTGEKDGEAMQQVDHTGLVPLLVAALGEALDRIDQLEARLA